MVRETRYLIVRNLPESCSEETVIDHFQRYGKIQSVKLQAAKDNGGTGTATVAFNDIKSAAKAHHANNSLGEATLRTDYWEGSTQTPVLVASTPALGGASSSSAATGSSRGVAPSGSSYANPPATRPVSSFASWAKGPSEEDSGLQDKGDSNSALAAASGGSATSSSTLALDKSITAFDIPRGRARERFSKKKKFEKSGSFGRHGTSSRSLEAARSQSEAAAAAAASASSASATTAAAASLTSVIASSSSSTTVATASSSTTLVSSNGPLSSGASLANHPVIVLTDGKDAPISGSLTSSSSTNNLINNNNNNGSNSNLPASKDSSTVSSSAHIQRDSSSSMSRSRPHTASPSSRHGGGPHSRNATSHRKSGSHRSRSGSIASRSRSRSQGSRSSSSRSDSSGTSRSTSPHRSFSSNTMRPQSMVGASRLVSSCEANKDLHNRRSGDDSAGDGDRRALGICVTGLPMRSTDSSLRDGLYHEYKKHGKVTTVQIFGEGDNRCAVVSFRKPEDASKALEASQGKTFFGAKIKVTSHEGVEVDDTDRSSDNDSMDEYHQKSTRTLFVGNLEKETTTQDLIDKFKQFGEIIDVDIKRQGATTAFAFVQYVDIASVVAALRAMEGEHIGINKIKLGFGKSMPTCCVWLDNIPGDMSNRSLRNTLSRYGDISYSFIDRNRNKGLVCFSSFEDAQHCVSDIKQRPHFMKKKLQIDFASRECHTDFLDKMEESGQLRASERPDESRVHKFRLQRSVDNYQEDGSPSSYGFNSTRTGSNVFSTPRNNGRTSATGSRRSRGFNDYPEENHTSSRRSSSRRDDLGPGGTFNSKGGDDYEAVLREYGHSQRERRERDQSPRRVDSQSRRGSRDVSLDRYEDQRSKDRNSLHNSRDTSPSSEHNSYRSESHRYRSSRGDEKYSSRGDRYTEESKGESKDFDIAPTHSHRSSRMGSPQYVNSNSMHSHESDYGARRGSRAGSRASRSQSPDVALLDDAYSTSSRGMFYPEDYKRSVVTEDELGSPYSSSKRRDVLDIESATSKSRSLALLSNNKLGAEVAKTAAEKSRRRIFEENLPISGGVDSKLLRKLEKSSPLSGSEREKTRHMLGKLASSKRRSGGGTLSSPGGLSSGLSQGGGSENGSAGEDLQHLHQRKQLLLMQIKELGDDPSAGALLAGGAGTASDSDSPHFIKSVAVKDALRRSGRSHDNGSKVDEDRILSRSDKLQRSGESRRSDNKGAFYSMREDRTPGFEEEGSPGGNHSDSDYDSDKQRSKRRLDGFRDAESVKTKDYHRQGSVDLSDSEDFEKKPDINARLNSSTTDGRAGCDIRSNSLGSKHLYEDKSLNMSASPCDNGDLFRDRLSDKDILVINKHRNSSKSNTSYLSHKDWSKDPIGVSEASPMNCFSPALSERGEEEDSVASSSLTEKSSKHPSSPLAWKRSPSVSPVPKDNDSEPDLSYLNSYNTLPDPLDEDDDDCLSDNSLVGGEVIPGPGPGDASWEERIRAIDRVLNMAPSSKAGQEFSLGGGSSSTSSSLSGTKDATSTDGGVSANRYAKYRIRKREEGGVAAGASDIPGNAGDNGSVLEQPSDIVQRVLSKKSILDQDFKRLEQVNKFDTTSAIHGSNTAVTCGILKDIPQLLLPSSTSSSLSSSLTVIKEEPLASPRSLSSKLAPPHSSTALSPLHSPSLNPVTTSSSVLQPTVTTCVAGSTLTLTSSSSLLLPSASITSALGSSTRALTTSSVCTPISSISLSHENSGSKDLLDTNVKTSVVILKNSSSCSSSKLVSSQSSLLSVSSSISSSTLSTMTTRHTSHVPSLSSSSISVSVTSSTSHVFNVQHASSSANSVSSSLSTSSSSLLQSKPVISSLPLPPSLLSSGTATATTSTTSAVKVLSSHHIGNPTSPVSSTPSSSSSSSVSLSSPRSSLQRLTCEPASHSPDLAAPAAAPFTQGPLTKSQQMPTLGQEAPQLTSPVFDPHSRELSTIASASCPRLPGDPRLSKALSGQSEKDKDDIGHTPTSTPSTAAVSRTSELIINLWGSKAEQTSSLFEDNKSSNPSVLVSKSEVVTPDIESPVSVKSGTSSTDSVPLSSLDTKPCISVSDERSTSFLTAEQGGTSVKVEPLSPSKVKDSTSMDKVKSTECEDSEDKTSTISNLLVPKKCEVSVPESATQATVLTVSSKNCPEKEEKLPSPDLGQLSKDKMDTLPPSSSASVALVADENRVNSTLQTTKPSSSSSSNTTNSAASATSVNSARPPTDKNEKKTPSKPKTAASSRTEALFAPDLKLEPPQQKASSSSSSSTSSSSSSRDNNKHKETHKSSSQSSSGKPSSSGGGSSGSDKKSLKNQASKDSSHGEKRDSSTSSSNREAEKLEKKPDSAHKTHEGSSKSKDLDKNKMKEKRDQSKESRSSSARKEKDDAKKKEEKKLVEKKEEKKGTVPKDEKKSEKRAEEKKEKSASSKQDTLKHSKSDQELSKKDKDKKVKEKTKEAGKDSKLDKKLLPGLSCVSKHSASPEPKSSKTAEGKTGNKESTNKAEKEKSDSSSSKFDSKASLKHEQKHKSDQKTGNKSGDTKSEAKETQAKKSSSDGSQKVKKETEKPGMDATQRAKKEDEKQGGDSASKGKKEAEKVGSSESAHKSKKEGDKDITKQSSSKHSDKVQKPKHKDEEKLKEKQRLKEQKEKEEKERREKEEREKQREREEKERQKEKEREEREKQKEKEREEKERQKAEKERKEKEEKERKEREEKERLKREKEERERQKEKEREERERQKEEREDKEKKEKEERERLKKEKAKQKEREEKEKKENEEKERLKREKERKERKEKEKKKAKEEKLKKEKEAKAKKEKEEKLKKEREEKEKEKEKDGKEEKKKPPPPKKHKRNELAALLDSNDSFQMSFTSMYDRVKTQRNRDTELQPNKSPSSASQRSSDKYKKTANKKSSKSKSSLYYSTSDLSDDDNLSETNESEDQIPKTELPSKDAKPKKTKQVKKRPHVSSSSSSSSSCEDDDDALLSATKSKGGKKTDIFSSDSEDDSFPPPSKSSKPSKTKSKPPAPKKKKVRADSIDSVGSNSKDGFVKPQQLLLSSVTETESLDDMDLSENEPPKVSKMKKKKGKTPEKRDSSVESVSKKSSKVERDSSSESVVRKPVKHEKEYKMSQAEKDVSPPKKAKLENKKNKQAEEKEKSSSREEVKVKTEEKKVDASEDIHSQRKSDVKKGLDISQDATKVDPEKHKSKEKLSAEKNSSESKSSSEKKKKKDREDGTVKKKKKKKYDPKEEEALVNSLITKVYDSKPDKERKKKKVIQSVFDIESDDLSLSETSLDVSQDKKSSMFGGKEETLGAKPKEKRSDSLYDSEKDGMVEKQQKVKPVSETGTKSEPVDKKPELQNKKEDQTEKVEKMEKKKEHLDKKHEGSDKKESKNKAKTEETVKPEPKNEPESERSESGKPPKKKKKKDHDRDLEREKGGKSGKSSKNLTSGEKKISDSHKGGEEDKKTSETKTSQMDVDEFTSFWGHPKPILIPKRLKDSKKSEDESSKSKDHKDDAQSDKSKLGDEDAKVKEEAQDKTERTDEDKPDDSPSAKTPESVATPKVESDVGEDIVVPISEAETTVVTENGQPASSESMSTSDSLVIEEQTLESSDEVAGDMTAIGSSVEINDDDDFPSLIIDEVSETGNDSKKKAKKDKKQQKKQKDINDRLDEVIASVAMGGSSDEDDGARQSPDVNLQDVIDEELKYDNKSSNESETRKSFIVSDFVFPDEKRKSTESKSTSETTSSKKEPEKKGFVLSDEETNKRDEDILKKLFVLCDPSVDKPVEIEDPKIKEEEKRKKEEEEKKKAEEEKKRVEEEKKRAEEKEKEEKDRRAREDSEETARAVECLLEYTFDGDLSPLCIEPAEREPPVESVSMSPSKEKSDVSIFPGSSIPEKVTANLDDKLLERKSTDKVFGESTDTLNLFATPSQNTHVPMFASPRRNSVGVNKDKTPEPVTTPSPQRQMRSPQRQPTPLQQSPQLPSPQQRPMPSPQQGPALHTSPQKIQSPQTGFMQSPQQKPLPSPQQHHPQSPSPQRPNQSPHRVGLQSPLLSPQRSPFFKDRSFISPGREALTACTFPQHDVDNMPLVQQPQRRVSSGVPIPPTPEHALDPQAARRKSQEFAVEQTLHSPRRNTISAPEEAATSVAHLDRRFSHGHQSSTGSSGGFFSKERSHSSLPQPVSISLDNAPHDKNYQNPVRSLTNLPQQENVLLSPKQRVSPGFHHKEQHSLDQPGPFQMFPNKTSVPEQIFSGSSITSMANQMFPPGQQPKVLPQQDPGLSGGKGLLLEKGGFKQAKVPTDQHAFRAGVLDKPPASLSKDPLFLHQKGLHQEPMFPQGKDIHHPIPEPFGHAHNKTLAPTILQQTQQQQHQEPMFSPKTQPNSPYTYPEVGYDFLNSQSPPKMGQGIGNYPLPSSEPSQLNANKQPPAPMNSDAFSQDPLFIAMSEASTRPPDQAPVPRRQDGLPPSFYQEPVPKPVFTPDNSSIQPQFEDEKKGTGTRKRRRSNKKLPKEGTDAALNERAIQEIVHSKLEQIHQVHQANQAKAAAEKAGTKKAVDAYDFEAHTGLESGDIPTRPAMSDLHHVTHTDGDTAKPFRMRNEGRGRGRGARGGGRGRRGRGGANANISQMAALQDKPQDPFHKSLHGLDNQFNSQQRRPGPEFPGQQQQPHPPLHQLDHHIQPHHDPGRLSGLSAPYHPPVSHHGSFPTSASQPSSFSRQMPPQQAGSMPGQPGFPQSFYQPQPAPTESGPGAFNLQDMPPKQPAAVSGIAASSGFQHLPPPPVSAAAGAPPPSQQPPQQQQPMLHLPQAKPSQQPLQAPLKASSGSDVLTPESNKQQHDLDSSYGESELVINLDDQPPSIEGKENQYSVSSDSEDRSSSSMAPSPATPRSQRATRTRKQPNYKAIASGMAQQQAPGSAVAQSPGAPGRTSRSGGSPRGLRATGPGSVGPPASPKSPRNSSSSPVVKLEKIEVGGGRTTRRGRSGMVGSKEDLATPGDDSSNNSNSMSQPGEDWKTRLGDQSLEKPAAAVAKDSIYDFADNEFDQQRDMPTSLRPNQRRNKKRGVASSVLETPDTGMDFMPTSPASSVNSTTLQSETKVGGFDPSSAAGPGLAGKPENEPSKAAVSTSLLSNVDAVIEAVAKGRFGDEEETEDSVLPATPAGAADPALSPPHTRSSRRTSEAKKENLSSVTGGLANAGDQKQEKTTFSIAEPRFDNREGTGAGRKGPTVPPLRIKVAHGMPKVEKEKHYVIASDHPQKPLSLTVKVAHKPAEGEGGRDLGLFSGLPQGDQGVADPKNVTSSVTSGPPSVSQGQVNWTKTDVAVSEENAPPAPTIVATRAGGAMHPKVAAKVASQEAGKASSIQQASAAQLSSKSSPLTSFPPGMTSVSGTPAHGPKHTWAAGHHLDQLQQAATSVAGGPPNSGPGPQHLPSHLLSSAGGPVSPMVSGPQRSVASLQDATHNQRNMGPAADMAAEALKHHQNQFGFPGHLPPTHGGSRPSFLLGSEGQAGHSMHFPGNLRAGTDVRNSKSPSLQGGGPQQHKLGPPGDARTRTPPVTSAGMLYSGVVSGIPRSLSPKSASPEGQVIERLPNPMRQGEQSPSPLGLRLPGSHHQDPSRFMKGPTDEHGREPPPAHGDQRTQPRDLLYQQIMEQQRLKQHLLLASTGGGFPPPNMRAGEQPEGAGSRKGSLSGPSGGNQPLNLTDQEPLSHRGTPKSTPPAPQSPFAPPMSFMDQRGGAPGAGNTSGAKPGEHLPATVASAFMQPSPGGHPQHMYHPEFSLASLAATGHHSPFGMMGRLPIDHRGIYSPGGNNGPPGGPQSQQQQGPPPHMLREGLPPGHFPPFPPRFDGKKGGDPGQELGLGPLGPGGILQSPSQSPSLPRQLQPTDLVRMSALAHDMPARESPVGILQRFPVMWQGGLALKNESSYVQMHFIAGNRRLPSQALPQPLPNGGLPPLRISQRMRLEHSQLDGVAKRMQCEDDYCILIAVACGRDEHDINHQTRALSEGFITYLLSKQAAGIVNVPLPGSEQAGFVVHIFPPCEFVDNSVAQQGSEALMDQLRQIPHAVIIIATTFT